MGFQLRPSGVRSKMEKPSSHVPPVLQPGSRARPSSHSASGDKSSPGTDTRLSGANCGTCSPVSFLHACSQPDLTLRRAFVAIILKVVYAKNVTGLDDPYLRIVNKSMEGLSLQKVPGAFWVEYFPWLKYIPSWFPGARFKKIAEHYKPVVETMINQPFDEVISAVVRPDPIYCSNLNFTRCIGEWHRSSFSSAFFGSAATAEA